jgi:hypothetical protein
MAFCSCYRLRACLNICSVNSLSCYSYEACLVLLAYLEVSFVELQGFIQYDRKVGEVRSVFSNGRFFLRLKLSVGVTRWYHITTMMVVSMMVCSSLIMKEEPRGAHLAICTRLALSHSLCESPSLFTCLLVRLFLLLPDSFIPTISLKINSKSSLE